MNYTARIFTSTNQKVFLQVEGPQKREENFIDSLCQKINRTAIEAIFANTDPIIPPPWEIQIRGPATQLQSNIGKIIDRINAHFIACREKGTYSHSHCKYTFSTLNYLVRRENMDLRIFPKEHPALPRLVPRSKEELEHLPICLLKNAQEQTTYPVWKGVKKYTRAYEICEQTDPITTRIFAEWARQGKQLFKVVFTGPYGKMRDGLGKALEKYLEWLQAEEGEKRAKEEAFDQALKDFPGMFFHFISDSSPLQTIPPTPLDMNEEFSEDSDMELDAALAADGFPWLSF